LGAERIEKLIALRCQNERGRAVDAQEQAPSGWRRRRSEWRLSQLSPPRPQRGPRQANAVLDPWKNACHDGACYGLASPDRRRRKVAAVSWNGLIEWTQSDAFSPQSAMSD
jgi:hypothetical protein